MKILQLLIAFIMLIQTQIISQPIAKKIQNVTQLHGETLIDNYFWLRDKSNPDVKNYLDEENKYTEDNSKDVKPLADKIYNEVLARWKQTDLSVPYFFKGFWYFTKTQEGKQYPVYCRKTNLQGSADEIILDQNELAKNFKFLSIGSFAVSDDANLIAYSLDTTGFRDYYLYIKDLRSGNLLADNVGRIGSVVWASDNNSFYYTTLDNAKRSYRLFRHILGEKNDELLFEEKDELYHVGVDKSSDYKYIFLTTSSSITTEVHYLAADNPKAKLTLLYPKKIDHKYYLDSRNGQFFILSNEGAKNYKLVTVAANLPLKENWQEFIPGRKDVKIEDFRLFENFAALTERKNGLNTIHIYNFTNKKFTAIPFSEEVYTSNIFVNMDFNATKIRYSYQSFVTPQSIFEYDMQNGGTTLLKQNEVLGGYDPTIYQSERIMVKSRDGVDIPVSLVYKKGTKKDGSAPMLLYGYGSYGISLSVAFSISRLSLLDRGVIYAQAHIRGGGDLGEEWHDEGKMMKKKNSFFDFIDCADYLVNNKYTSRTKLSIEGGSAGGLLIGAVLNFRPDLCKAAHLAVPFVDVINTMFDESLPLTVGEFLEWGNPKKKNEYEYLKTYCPYTNLQETNYPSILITTSFNDSQVMYWEPAKYTAKLRTLLPKDNLLLLKTNMAGGHGGSSGRYDVIKEQAFAYAFLLNQIGVK